MDRIYFSVHLISLQLVEFTKNTKNSLYRFTIVKGQSFGSRSVRKGSLLPLLGKMGNSPVKRDRNVIKK